MSLIACFSLPLSLASNDPLLDDNEFTRLCWNSLNQTLRTASGICTSWIMIGGCDSELLFYHFRSPEQVTLMKAVVSLQVGLLLTTGLLTGLAL